MHRLFSVDKELRIDNRPFPWQIEEENVQDDDRADDSFVEEMVGAESKPYTGENTVEDTPIDVDVASGGEEVFEWGDEDA